MPSALTRRVLVIAAGLLAPIVIDVKAWEAGLELPGMRIAAEVATIREGDWSTGQATQRVEAQLVAGSLISRFLVPHYNALLFRALGRTVAAARRGEDGFIFLARRTRALPAWRYDELVNEVARRVHDSVQEVEKRGHRVVVAIIPDRSRMYPQYAYPLGSMAPAKAKYLGSLVAALRARGVDIVDFEPALRRAEASGKRAFYRADHHWTSRGAEASARLLAAHLVSQERLEGCDLPGYREFEVRWFAEAEETSLLPKLGWPADGPLERSYDATYPRARFIAGGSWRRGHAPILYVTTSYGQWGAPETLSNLLGCPVQQASRSGSSFGVHGTLADRMDRYVDAEHTRVVIWELVEYDLYSAAGVPLGTAE